MIATVTDNGSSTTTTSAVTTITITDVTVPGTSLRLSETALTMAEGSTTTYNVVLDVEPTGTVTVTITGDNADITPDSTTLTFTTDDWRMPQTVTLTAAPDDDASDDVAMLTHTASGGDYDSITAHDLTITVTDDDTAGLTLSPTTLMLDEGTTTTYTAVLDTEPTGTVTVSINQAGEVTTSPTTLRFTTDNWNTAQTVTLTAAPDSDITDDDTTLRHTASGGDYDDVTADLTVTVTDSTPGYRLSETALTMTEGSTTTYSVALSTQPTSPVRVGINQGRTPDSRITALPGFLTFMADTWNIAQTVTLTALPDADAIDNEIELSHFVPTSLDINYSGTRAILTVTVIDDDIPGLRLSDTALTVAEGSTTHTYSVALNIEPSDTVTVDIVSTNPDVTLDSTTLTFDDTNWSMPQTVTITANPDTDLADDDATLAHTITSPGTDYTDLTVVNLAVTVTDTTPGLVLTPTTLTLDEGATTTYSAVLNTQPTADVMVTIAGDADVTPDPATLTFTASTWNTPQPVTLTAAEDADAADDVATLTHAIASTGDANYNITTTTDLAVTVTDNDIPGLTLTPTTLMLDEGATTTYSAVLDAEPTGTVTGTVTVTITSDNNTDVTLTPAALTFTASTWNTPQTVTITANPDTDVADDVATLTHAASGGDYGNVTANLSVTVIDTTPGLVLTPTTLTLDEGATTTYSAVLNTQPSETVTVTIESNNPDVTPDPAPTTLTFIMKDWNTPQTVTLTAAEDDDAADDVATLTHTITSTDTDYSNITTVLAVTVTDNDTDTDITTRLNEQILTRAAQAMTAGISAAVAARVEAAADGSGKPLAFELDGRSSLRRLLEKNGKAMLEDRMDYERLLDGASFVLPLSATDDASSGNTGETAVWGSSGFRNLADNADGLDWEGKTLSAHLGIDKRLSEQALAGLALSWNDANFDYKDTADGENSEGEYQYSVVTIHPYFGWSNDGLKLWGTVGFGQGEITIEEEDGDEPSTNTTSTDTMSTDTAQLSVAGGFNQRLTGSPGRGLHIKGDVALTQVAVEADQAGKFDQQDIANSRVRLLLSGERRRKLASGGALTPSLEVGVRSDGGDGTTGTGAEVGAGLRYANSGGTLAVAGNVRTLLADEYEESGADFSVRLSSKSGRGLSLTLHPVWGRTQSVADRLWNDGASDITAGEITASEITGGDAALQGSVDTEVGYGMAATMLGSPGILTPYTGMTAQDGGSSRLRLGGRFVGGNGLSMNLEGSQENTADGASHQVLLRGEVAF